MHLTVPAELARIVLAAGIFLLVCGLSMIGAWARGATAPTARKQPRPTRYRTRARKPRQRETTLLTGEYQRDADQPTEPYAWHYPQEPL